MTTMTDTRLQLEKLDQQILRLLADRRELCRQAREQGEGLDLPDVQMETISLWNEEAVDLNMDEVIADKIAKLTIRLCRTDDED